MKRRKHAIPASKPMAKVHNYSFIHSVAQMIISTEQLRKVFLDFLCRCFTVEGY